LKIVSILVSSIVLFISCHDEEKPWWWVPETIAEYPCWTPDGSKIAYRRGEQQVWIYDTLFHSTWNMFEGSSLESGLPNFSPDGKWMAFVSGVNIYKVRLTNDWKTKIVDTTIVKLTDLGHNFFPKWSPKGNLIAFDSNAHDTSELLFRIWLMTTEGNDKRMVVDVDGRQPDWSPDGDRIVYYGFFEESDAAEIVIISPDGSNSKRLTNDSFWDQDPAWSPDGKQIAFVKDTVEYGKGAEYIYLMDTSGTKAERLTSGYEPAWSPDGKKLAFIDLDFTGEYWTLYTINVITKKREQLIFK
jgi:Tol biopolymer transport system component